MADYKKELSNLLNRMLKNPIKAGIILGFIWKILEQNFPEVETKESDNSKKSYSENLNKLHERVVLKEERREYHCPKCGEWSIPDDFGPRRCQHCGYSSADKPKEEKPYKIIVTDPKGNKFDIGKRFKTETDAQKHIDETQLKKYKYDIFRI